MRIPLPPVPLPEAVVDVAREYADGTRTAVEPRDAATVILLRDSGAGPEAYIRVARDQTGVGIKAQLVIDHVEVGKVREGRAARAARWP